MLKHLLALSLTIPLCGYCQSYGDSPFYKPISAVPSTAHVEGWEHGTTKANGVVIDLSVSEPPLSSPDYDELRGGSIHSWVDRNRPVHIFHYFRQYNQLNVVYGYDLLVEPVQGTDEIRCTFMSLSDPEIDWHRDKDIPVIPLTAFADAENRHPFLIKSGGAISITTQPLGKGKIEVVHYIRLTRTDLATAPAQ